LTNQNVHLREYYGVTNVLSKPDEKNCVVQVISLSHFHAELQRRSSPLARGTEGNQAIETEQVF
jgi:hypothetical protein